MRCVYQNRATLGSDPVPDACQQAVTGELAGTERPKVSLPSPVPTREAGRDHLAVNPQAQRGGNEQSEAQRSEGCLSLPVLD